MPLTQEQLDALDKLLATSPQLKQVAPIAYANIEKAVGQAVTQVGPEMQKWAAAQAQELNGIDLETLTAVPTVGNIIHVIIDFIIEMARVPGAEKISQAILLAIAKDRLSKEAAKVG
jgi:hypothetical protein